MAGRDHDVVAAAAGKQLGFEYLVGIEDVIDDLDAGFLGEFPDDRLVDVVGPVIDVDDALLRPGGWGQHCGDRGRCRQPRQVSDHYNSPWFLPAGRALLRSAPASFRHEAY
jgi:hypothetical protein